MVRFGWGRPSIIDDPLDLDWGYCRPPPDERRGLDPARSTDRRLGLDRTAKIFLRGLPEDIENWASVAGPGLDWPTMDAAYRALEAEGPSRFRIRRWPRETWVATQAAFVDAYFVDRLGALDDHNAADAMGAGGLPFNQDDPGPLEPAAGVI